MDIARQRRLLIATVCLAGLSVAASMATRADDDQGRRSGDRGGFDRGRERGGFVIPGGERRGGRDDGDFGSRMSLDSAIDLVLSRFGGEVVKAETQSRDGQLFYLIRVLTPDGTLMRVRVNALTGRMD